MATDRFVSLHRHDQYSLFDGLDNATRAAARVEELGQTAVALTNHGAVTGLVEHYRACTERGIKPILGMEGYITFTSEKPTVWKGTLSHITLLVENAIGYRNLMRLVNASQDLFYYKPRMSVRMLLDHADGLLVLSGCPSSLFAKLIAAGRAEDAEGLFKRVAHDLRGRFFGEIQHRQPVALTQAIVAWSAKYDVPLVMTNDAHYVAPEDRAIHDMMLKMRFQGAEKGEEDPTYGEGFYIPRRTDAEHLMREAHPWMTTQDLRLALDRTVDIAARCDFEFKKPTKYLPDFWKDPEAQFKGLVADAIRAHRLERDRTYLERAKRELDLILRKGYAPYFMVCWEFVQEAKRNGILVGPRGSVCGSLVAFILGITMVDPLKHGTLFERFLHEERKTLPDVDLDIDARHRDRMLNWVLTRFAPHAIPIITIGRYSAASLANDLAREYRLDNEDRNDLSFALGDLKWRRIYTATEDDLAQSDVFDRLARKHKGFKNVVIKLFSQARYIGRHPGGVCFVPTKDPTPWLATVKQNASAEGRITCYNFVDVEYLGLLKFDFLGLTAMGAISQTIDLVKERTGGTIRLADIPLDDKGLFERFAKADTSGIFQFDTRGAREGLKDIRPENFLEVAVATALNRPGVSENMPDYLEGKEEGRSKGAFGETYGAVVFQENIMQYLRTLGFTWGEADLFIKTIKGSGIQKLTSPEVRAVYQKFMEAQTAKGATKQQAEERIDRLTKYSFNKAHAVAYALVAYWGMWLRAYHPTEFWCATLSVEGDDKKRAHYERAAIFDGCVFLPPHVNGTMNYSIGKDGGILVGLGSIKDIGPKAMEAIIGGQPYARARDIKTLPRRAVNSKVIWALIRAGALIMDEEEVFRYAVRYDNARKKGESVYWRPGC